MMDEIENVSQEMIAEEVTAEEVFGVLEKAWVNERLSPELLPHSAEMLDLMLGQIAHMENNLNELDKKDLRVLIHSLELGRMRFLVANYLKCRLTKIEQFTNYILQQEATTLSKLLTPSELKFAKDYREMQENHLFQVATKYMPINLQQDDSQQRTLVPNLSSYEAIQVASDSAVTIVGNDDEEIILAPNTLHIVPYQLISDLLKDGKVRLI